VCKHLGYKGSAIVKKEGFFGAGMTCFQRNTVAINGSYKMVGCIVIYNV
jgi:hypothetical protein